MPSQKSHYTIAGQRVALRVSDGTSDRLYYLLTDHLGSTSVITDATGNVVARQGYLPFGGERYSQIADPNAFTSFDFTGQRLDGTGLHFYNARYYSSAIGRFVSADTLVPEPGNPQSLNRYSYGHNNPLRYTDPTGHREDCGWDQAGCSNDGDPLPGWDEYHASVIDEETRRAAEAAYLLLLANPEYFAALYVDPRAWATSMDVKYLEVFGAYSQLHTRADTLVLNTISDRYGYEAAGNLYDLWLAAGVGRIAPTEAGGLAAALVGGAIPNAIGRQGAVQVGQQLPVEIGEFRMPGGERIYDGRFAGTADRYVEIKTSTRSVVRMNPAIRAQIAFDADMSPKPMWIFNNARPSSSVIRALQAGGIPWHELHP